MMREFFRRLRFKIASSLMRAYIRRHPPLSNWQRTRINVLFSRFGRGSRHPFPYYFEGKSSVHVESLADIATWLMSCEYTSDMELFNDVDFWQHPVAFEQLRRGDCEDYALWAWRKLSEINIKADLYVGRVVVDPDGTATKGHAWIVFATGTGEFLLETTAKDVCAMIRPLHLA